MCNKTRKALSSITITLNLYFFVCFNLVQSHGTENATGSLTITTAKDTPNVSGIPVADKSEISSLDGFLHWAIENSDTDSLAAAADQVSKLSPDELAEKRQHMKDVMDAMKMPSNSELIKRSLTDLRQNFNVLSGIGALYELLELLESIDNANDFMKMDGLSSLRTCWHHSDSEIRILSMWVLGVACQNNPLMQQQVIEEGLLREILVFTESAILEESLKGLYTLSACIRNNKKAQAWFFSQGGQEMLARLLDGQRDVRVHKKVITLLSDLALQPVPAYKIETHTLRLLVSFLELSEDVDLIERTLLLVTSLVSGDEPLKQFLRTDCSIERVLGQLDLETRSRNSDEVDPDYIVEVKRIQMALLSLFSS